MSYDPDSDTYPFNDSETLLNFLDRLLLESVSCEGGLVPLTVSRMERIAKLTEGVSIDD
jgi:hypothetical protein